MHSDWTLRLRLQLFAYMLITFSVWMCWVFHASHASIWIWPQADNLISHHCCNAFHTINTKCALNLVERTEFTALLNGTLLIDHTKTQSSSFLRVVHFYGWNTFSLIRNHRLYTTMNVLRLHYVQFKYNEILNYKSSEFRAEKWSKCR